MSYARGRVVKITPHRYYLRSSVLIRIIKIVKKSNAVHVYRYDSFENDVLELDTIQFGLVPVFKIGDVGKMLDRKPDTIRKYEKRGLIPPGKKFPLVEDGSAAIRLYTETDVADLTEFFSQRSTTKKKHSAINQNDVVKGLQSRFHQIKNVGGKI